MFAKIFALFFFLLLLFTPLTPILAQENSAIKDERFEAVVESILNEKEIEVMGKKQTVQDLELKITSGAQTNQIINIKNGALPTTQQTLYRPGDKIVVSVNKDAEGKNVYLISDYVRRDTLIWLAGLFVMLVIFIGGKKGIASIVGLVFSFLVIFTFILPQIASGASPVIVAILGSLMILPLNFYLSHGLNKKTTIALLSTLIALAFTGILAIIFVNASHLSGYASDEATFLQAAKQGSINIQGLLLAGIIIGVLGILDDVTVSQASIVFELKKTLPSLKFRELYKKAMNVGRDHIASVVNTLILVYAGASLPLLLLFIDNPVPYQQVINYEMIAEEIVRTLVASIGLISAIPLTTFLAAWIVTKDQ